MREAVHRDPVWRDGADFIIAARIDPGDTGVDTEQLWARRIDDGRHELCCIPFFAYDLALGEHAQEVADVLQAREDRDELVYETGKQKGAQ